MLHRIGRVALAVTAGAGAVCLLLSLAAVVTGERPLVFRSGSMSPGIPTGSLGFARTVSANDIHVGDVVTVHTKGGSRVTHRVVDLTRHGNEATLQLKGDANKVADEALYPVRNAPRLSFSVPRAGYVVAWLSHAPGSYLLALYVALMLALLFRRSADPGPRSPAPVEPESAVAAQPPADGPTAERDRRRPVLAIGIAGALALGLVALAGWGSSTWATWTDTANVSGTTLSTGTFVAPPNAPVVTCGALGKKLVTLTWAAVPGATSYDLYYPNGSTLAGNQTGTSFAFDGTANVIGDFSVKARNGSVVSAMSNSKHYDTGTGSGSGTCT